MATLGAPFPPYFDPFGPTTTPTPPGARPAEELPPPEPGQRYTRGVAEQVGSIDAVQLEELFRNAGVDMDAPAVQSLLAKAKADLRAAENQDEVAQVMAQVTALLPVVAAANPAFPPTAYAQAIERSGFAEGGVTQLGVTTPTELRGLDIPPHELVVGGRFAEHPETGWIQYANGVLVDPDVPLGAGGGVYYKPGSTAPGSPDWLRNVVPGWSPEKVSEWGKRLVEMGYLDKASAKLGVESVPFQNALALYHQVRYQHGGKPLSWDEAGAGGEAEYRLTAHDFQTEIRNDVRDQWMNSFGNMPSDAELEQWTRFITKTSLRVQRNLERRGVPSGTAAGIAAERAGQELIEEVGYSPEATYLQEQYQENTQLRDALETAVSVTRALGQ